MNVGKGNKIKIFVVLFMAISIMLTFAAYMTFFVSPEEPVPPDEFVPDIVLHACMHDTA
jgi:hypothetical protein